MPVEYNLKQFANNPSPNVGRGRYLKNAQAGVLLMVRSFYKINNSL